MKLSEKLIKLRKEKGLSQEEFGNQINVSRQAVSKWENDECKPDIDKVQEIVKNFNVSFEYLLNDEFDSNEEVKEEKQNEIVKKPRKRIILKIILIILFVYCLICIYKFIAFYRFYLIANSFSENNYSMFQDFNGNTEIQGYYGMSFYTKKVGNKIIKESNFFRNRNEKEDYSTPHDIDFIDLDKKNYYTLRYDNDTDKYTFYDRKNDLAQGETIEDVLENYNVNLVKENTLLSIPSGFKQIFLASINPCYYYVDIVNREYKAFSIKNNVKTIVKLNNDFLLEDIVYISEDEGAYLSSYYSYDYVQDHFTDIKEPLETYKDKIIYEE